MKAIFHVIKTGLVTSFQDKGRHGYQAYGVVASGAMDVVSFQLANLLVGNNKEEACIEMAIVGPSLTVVCEEVTIAVTGTDVNFCINGVRAPMWKAIKVKKSDKLSFRGSKDGMYAYVAVRGGYEVPFFLGSKSYYGKAKLGTAICEGDYIVGKNPSTLRWQRGLIPSAIPTFEKNVRVRVILGPHDEDFTEESVRTFFSQAYTVMQCDRMGTRLKGTFPLTVHDDRDVLSDAIPLGGIQVPKGGQPIVLLADRQTTGGYRRIGTVIQADLPKLVQVPIGGTIFFQKATLKEAYEAMLTQQGYLNVINHSSYE